MCDHSINPYNRTLSPFFPVTDDKKIHAFRIAAKQATINVQVASENIFDYEQVQDIHDAEQMLLNFNFKSEVGYARHIQHLIQRAGSYIALHTRRGAGNRVFMNRDFFSRMCDYKILTALILEDPCEIGDWSYVGSLLNKKLYLSDTLPLNTCFVMYYGEVHPAMLDGPAILQRTGQTHQLLMLNKQGHWLSHAQEYVQKIIIEHELISETQDWKKQ